MTLTQDRRTALIGGCPLFHGIDAAGLAVHCRGQVGQHAEGLGSLARKYEGEIACSHGHAF